MDGFSLDTLSSIKSYKGRIDYCKQHLKPLGTGSSRIVFALDDTRALKLALNHKGIHQNHGESDYGKSQMYGEMIARILEDHEEDMWIVVDRGEKLTKKRFDELTGVSFSVFVEAIQCYMRSEGSPFVNNTGAFESLMSSNEFFHELMLMVKDFDQSMGDFTRIGSWGERDGDVILLDHGLTNSMYRELYDKPARSSRYANRGFGL